MKINREALGAPAFRSLMAGHPSGVAVVTTLDAAGEPQGLTCSSLCSVSVEPPLLLVCIANHSRTLAALDSLGLFAVNLLHDHGRDVARHFSSNLGDRFRAVTWAGTKEADLPYLPDDAHSVAECRLHSVTVAGDHTIIVGEVFSVDHLAPARPLIYGLRQYAAWPKEG
ncbi:flavin reductase family protein [Streptosporangium sp. CA-135522]|uniref:flavin reductase family protein n=1 Tax=Streptosporangium sp. CA-135522 TaxID=3240072 RepID=UPI003D8F72DF